MTAFCIGLIVGFIMCIPIGPINVCVVNTELKKGFGPAFAIALGGSLMDFIYFMLIMSGLSLVTLEPSTAQAIRIFGILVLMFIGIKELLARPSLDQFKTEIRASKRNHFLLGILIYVTNPTLMATMSGLATWIKSWQAYAETPMNHFLISLGLSVGSAGWFLFILKLIKRYRAKFTDGFLLKLNRTCGVLIIVFCMTMAFKIFKEMTT